MPVACRPSGNYLDSLEFLDDVNGQKAAEIRQFLQTFAYSKGRKLRK